MPNRKKSMLTQNQVKELFHYDTKTGSLIWRVDCGKNKMIGKFSGTLKADGYRYISINNKIYFAHRLVWLFNHGIFPANNLDHINGNKDDNRIENLREATDAQNLQNRRKANSTNKSGYLGVSSSHGKWQAAICINGKQMHIGTYMTPEDAHAAYLAKKRELHPFGTL